MRISDWSSDVCSSDLPGLDAEARQQLGNDVEAGAEEGARGDHAVASLELRHQRGEDRAHPAGGRHADLGAFQQAQALLEHCPRRVGVARVLVALDRKSVVEGKGVSVRVDPGGRRSIKKKKKK